MSFVENSVLFAAVKEFCNWSRTDKVIVRVRVAPFFETQCRLFKSFIHIRLLYRNDRTHLHKYT